MDLKNIIVVMFCLFTCSFAQSCCWQDTTESACHTSCPCAAPCGRHRSDCVGADRYSCWSCPDYNCQNCGPPSEDFLSSNHVQLQSPFPGDGLNTSSASISLQCSGGFARENKNLAASCILNENAPAGSQGKWQIDGSCMAIPNEECPISFEDAVFDTPPIVAYGESILTQYNTTTCQNNYGIYPKGSSVQATCSWPRQEQHAGTPSNSPNWTYVPGSGKCYELNICGNNSLNATLPATTVAEASGACSATVIGNCAPGFSAGTIQAKCCWINNKATWELVGTAKCLSDKTLQNCPVDDNSGPSPTFAQFPPTSVYPGQCSRSVNTTVCDSGYQLLGGPLSAICCSPGLGLKPVWHRLQGTGYCNHQ